MVRAQLSKDAALSKKKRIKAKDRTLDALMVEKVEAFEKKARYKVPPTLELVDDELIKASQQDQLYGTRCWNEWQCRR